MHKRWKCQTLKASVVVPLANLMSCAWSVPYPQPRFALQNAAGFKEQRARAGIVGRYEPRVSTQVSVVHNNTDHPAVQCGYKNVLVPTIWAWHAT